jgi:hypothetical protein
VFTINFQEANGIAQYFRLKIFNAYQHWGPSCLLGLKQEILSIGELVTKYHQDFGSMIYGIGNECMPGSREESFLKAWRSIHRRVDLLLYVVVPYHDKRHD